MTEISMREQAANIGITDLSGGFLNAVLNPFWLSSSANLDLFPFRNSDGISCRLMAQTWKWPSGWTITINPNNSDNANYANLFQGIACDGNAWFITNGGPPKDWGYDSPPRLWRRNLSTDLDAHSSITILGIHYVENPSSLSDSYVHFGDCCVIWDGGESYVAVAVEYHDKPNHLLVWKIHNPSSSFDPYMTFFDATPLTQDLDEAPWFSVMPGTSLGFCSPFFNTTPPNTSLHIYEIAFNSSKVTLSFHDDVEFPLYYSDGTPFDVGRIQGGAVSGAGHLYLVCDKLGVDGGGLYGFDLISGRKMEFVSLGDGGGGGALSYELVLGHSDCDWLTARTSRRGRSWTTQTMPEHRREVRRRDRREGPSPTDQNHRGRVLEGMCVFDTSGVPGASGQIHVGKIRLDVNDDLFIYHINALPGEEGLV